MAPKGNPEFFNPLPKSYERGDTQHHNITVTAANNYLMMSSKGNCSHMQVYLGISFIMCAMGQRTNFSSKNRGEELLAMKSDLMPTSCYRNIQDIL